VVDLYSWMILHYVDYLQPFRAFSSVLMHAALTSYTAFTVVIMHHYDWALHGPTRDGVLKDWPRTLGQLEYRILWSWPWPRGCLALDLASNTLSSNPLTDCNVSLCSGLSGLTRCMCERLQVLHYLFNTFLSNLKQYSNSVSHLLFHCMQFTISHWWMNRIA